MVEGLKGCIWEFGKGIHYINTCHANYNRYKLLFSV